MPTLSSYEYQRTRQGANGSATLNEALLEFQRDPPSFVKDGEAEVKPKGGGQGYKYQFLTLQALLAGLRPVLSELGLVWRSWPTSENGQAMLNYSLSLVNGKTTSDTLEGAMPLMVPPGAHPQAYGSALSFARRYALITVLNLAPDQDEDAAEAHAPQVRTINRRRALAVMRVAKDVGQIPRLQLIASHAVGRDVGDCSKKEPALAAMMTLTAEQAKQVEAALRKAGEANG